MNLTHQFLIAMPSLEDRNFSGSVIYVCDHTDRGALGLVINRPSELTLEALFEKIDLSLEISVLKAAPVYLGGPVHTERGFVLHRPAGVYGSSLAVHEDIALTTSKDVLEQIANGAGPDQILVTLGCAGWAPGQLEREIAENSWLTVAANPQILFETPAEMRQAAALRLLGVDAGNLSGAAGHA
jgi:putative transcriptional regulator